MSTLLYCLGEGAEDRLASTTISEADRKKYDAVVGTLDSFFNVRKNVIFERARFNRRCQLPEEPADRFIAALYTLAESCEYGTLRDEMIRDRIVVGIRSTALSQRMQMDAKLTLESAKMQVRQSEAVQEQQLVLHTPAKQEMGVEMIRSRGRPATPWSRGQSRSPRGRPQKERPSEGAKCSRCGRRPHPCQACPARDAVCHNCQKKGHYSAQCRTESDVKELTQTDTVYDTSYLTAVTNKPDKAATAWIVVVAVNGKQLYTI